MMPLKHPHIKVDWTRWIEEEDEHEKGGVGHGDDFDPDNMQDFGAGDYEDSDGHRSVHELRGWFVWVVSVGVDWVGTAPSSDSEAGRCNAATPAHARGKPNARTATVKTSIGIDGSTPAGARASRMSRAATSSQITPGKYMSTIPASARRAAVAR